MSCAGFLVVYYGVFFKISFVRKCLPMSQQAYGSIGTFLMVMMVVVAMYILSKLGHFLKFKFFWIIILISIL